MTHAYNSSYLQMSDSTYQLALAELAKYGFEAELRYDASLPSFQISSQGNRLTIAAPDSTELLYGVYELAERFGGYCFFEPGVDRYNPSLRQTIFPDGILVPAKKPPLAIRGFIQEFPFDQETPLLFDWMAKNKLNYLNVWMKYFDELSPERKEMAAIRGIYLDSGHHNFSYWIPSGKYHRQHPEFFAERDGKRICPADTKDVLLLGSEQLCTTNQELRDEIVKNMLRYLEENPQLKVLSLIPNDGFGWCECPECSKFYDKNEKGELYSVSEHVYKADRIYHDMLRYVAAKLHEVRPDITLEFVAYVNYTRPAPGFTLDPNTMVQFANYWRCINHRISDAACPFNSRLADDLLAWVKAKRGGKVLVYEYFMGINFYLSLPMIHNWDIFPEVQWYAEQGIDGVLTQFHLTHWCAYGMNYYMFAKAARGEECQSANHKMFQALFGKDAPQAEAFCRQVKEFLLSVQGKCHIPYPHSLFSRVTQQQCQELLQSAKDLQAQAPQDTFRQNIVLWMEYLCRFKDLFDKCQNGTLTITHVDDFQNWAHSLQNRRILVLTRLDMYLPAIRDAIKQGKTWLHFNIDWEDNYIKKHHDLWTGHK